MIAALTIAVIAAALFGPALLARQTQPLIAPVEKKPLPPFHGGTDDAAEWAAVLREKVLAGTAARPGASVIQFPGGKS